MLISSTDKTIQPTNKRGRTLGSNQQKKKRVSKEIFFFRLIVVFPFLSVVVPSYICQVFGEADNHTAEGCEVFFGDCFFSKFFAFVSHDSCIGGETDFVCSQNSHFVCPFLFFL